MVNKIEIISEERVDNYIKEAARLAWYEEGFGVTGCDLSVETPLPATTGVARLLDCFKPKLTHSA